MKVVVVGCTHTGTAAIAKINELYDDVELNVYEMNDTVSFLSCGIAMCVDKTVDDINSFFYSSPDALRELGVNMFMKHKVTDIDFENKKIKALNLMTNEVVSDDYDKLIITTGSWPIIPKIEGRELENVMLCKNFGHAKQIMEKAEDAKRVAIVGCGYIGMELAEAYHNLGKEVIIIDLLDDLLGKYLDEDYSKMIGDVVANSGIELALGHRCLEFKGDKKVEKVITDKGEFDVDTVILAVGFRPNNDLVKDKLETQANGSIVVDKFMKTSNKDVFAGGDSVCLDYIPTGGKSYLPLATNAVRTGAIIAANLKEDKAMHPGTNATSSVKVFGHHISTTGLTLKAALNEGINATSVTSEDSHLFEFVEGATPQYLKIVFDNDTRRVIGAQFISKALLPQTINVLSLAIHKEATIDELAYADFYFMPHFNKVWNIINIAAQKAL
jgi:NADPH-dependent 2,4-dienoyl-CoA reductase/sulfur reductase-like enzyme